MRPLPLVLVGMPWSGKTSLGRALADKLNRPFLDTDEWLSKLTGMPLNELVAQKGELAFRQMEWEVTEQVMNGLNGGIIATGGGVVETAGAMQRIMAQSHTLFLNAPLDLLIKRMLEHPPSRIWERGLADWERKKSLEMRYLRRLPEFLQAPYSIRVVDNWDVCLSELARVAEFNNF